jgi:hypothetical protein
MPILYKKCLITVSGADIWPLRRFWTTVGSRDVSRSRRPILPTSPSMPGYSFLDENNWTSSDEEDMFDEASRIAARMRTRRNRIKESEAKKNPRKMEEALRSRRCRRGCPEPRGRRARDRLKPHSLNTSGYLHARTRSTRVTSYRSDEQPTSVSEHTLRASPLGRAQGLQFSNRHSGKLAKKQSNSPENRPNHSA